MPTQITFISLTKEVAIPLKIFIKNIPTDPTTTSSSSNPQNTSSSSSSATSTTTTSLSINEKSPITIHNINQAKLNNSQIEHIVNAISPRLKNLLFYDLHNHQPHDQEEEEQEQQESKRGQFFGEPGSKNENYFKTNEFKIDNLKIVVPVDVLFQVRYKLGLVEYDEARKYLRDCGFNLVVVDRLLDNGASSPSPLEDEEDGESVIENDAVIGDTGEIVDREMEEAGATNVTSRQKRHIFNGKQIIGHFATCIKVYVF
ncbi:hypothetical protein I9W82_000613 [Candida metapsilosis]|uniref:Uncharacterized protein n=1 Tax=Candida metapsilosis TaxID=273372 RepID=A0A8H8DDK0_9ASCO|nr:hypothetical protein I9W82_000613 [Candida metapsilosis]